MGGRLSGGVVRPGLGDGDVGTALVSTDGRFRRVDATFCRLVARSEDALLGRVVTEVWPDVDLRAEVAAAIAICRGEASYASLTRSYPGSDGDTWSAEVGIFGARDAAGERVVWIRLRVLDGSREVPSIPPAAAADDDTLLTFDRGKVGAAIIGLDGRARRVNPALCRICARTAEEMSDIDLLAITHPDDQTRELELALEVWTGASDGWSTEKRLVRPDGSTVWVQQEVAVVRDEAGRPRHFLAQAVDIDHQKEVEASLRESRERVELLTRELPIGLLEIARDGRIVAANPALVELLGHDPVASGSQVTDLVDPSEVDAVVESFLESVADSDDWASEFRLAIPDGSTPRWVRAFVRSHIDADGSFRWATGAWVEVTDEITARAESARFTELLADVPDFVAIASTDGRVVYRNPAAATVIPSATDDAIDLIGLFDRRSQERVLLDVLPTLESAGAWSGELTLQANDGTCRPVLASMTLHRDDAVGVEYVTVIARDITELKQVEDLLREQATRDALTGLHNRAAVHAAIERALAHAPGRGAVLFVDLDLFKEVNDGFGHEAGDALLVEVARRIEAAVREGDVVGRIGGDEFVVLCRDATRGDARMVGERIVAAMAVPATWADARIPLGASVGVAHARTGDTARELIARADEGVYLAKARGRSQVASVDEPGA